MKSSNKSINKPQFNHVIITGGGSGLGHGLATRYLKLGAVVSVIDLQFSEKQKAMLEVTAKQCTTQCCFYTANVTDAESVRAAVLEAVAVSGSPDLAINSAGILINKIGRAHV